MPAKSHELPIMSAFIQEKRLALRHGMDVDTVCFEVVWKWLFDIQNHIEDMLVIRSKPVKDVIDVRWLFDRAIEIDV